MPSSPKRSQQLPRQLFLGLFLASSALLLAHVVNAYLAQSLDPSMTLAQPVNVTGPLDANPVASKVSSRHLAENILSSGLFPLPPNATLTFSPGAPRAAPVPPPPPLNVWSRVKLLGVVTSMNGNERAVLEEANSKTQTLYRVGQSIQNVGELIAIEPNRVLFRDGAQEEWLYLAIIPPGTNTLPRLLGVVMGMKDHERAVFEEADGKTQAFYRAGQSVHNMGELIAIEPNRVLLRKGTQEEWLNLAIIPTDARINARQQVAPTERMVASVPVKPFQTPLVSRTSLPRRSVDRALFEELMSDPDMFMTEARLQPHVSARGQVDGFRVEGLRRAGVLAKTGLQEEDILSRINGVEIRGPELLWNMLKQLPNEQTVRMDVLRSNTPVTLVVDIRS
ncbi:MAG: type II secretion system protein N [Nitrospira sp.]